MVTVKFKLLSELAVVPSYAKPGDSGMDLTWVGHHTDFTEASPVELLPGHFQLFDTDLALEIPEGFEGQIRPRSGLASRNGVTVLNTPGTIDSGFRGHLKVLLFNASSTPAHLMPGDKIAQLVICPVIRAEIVEAKMLSDTARGEGGFGSSGR